MYRTFEQDTAPGAGAAGRRPHHRPRRVRRRHGPVGLRQVDAAQPDRRARRARRGRDRRRRRVARRHGRERAGHHAPPAHRHRLPVLQPPRGHDRARERRDAGRHRRAASASRPRRGPATCSTCSASATRPGRRPACCRVVSASAWPSPGPWPTSRRCCSPTSRPARSTPRAATRCSSCSAGCTPGGQTILLVTHDDAGRRRRPPHRADARRPGRGRRTAVATGRGRARRDGDGVSVEVADDTARLPAPGRRRAASRPTPAADAASLPLVAAPSRWRAAAGAPIAVGGGRPAPPRPVAGRRRRRRRAGGRLRGGRRPSSAGACGRLGGDRRWRASPALGALCCRPHAPRRRRRLGGRVDRATSVERVGRRPAARRSRSTCCSALPDGRLSVEPAAATRRRRLRRRCGASACVLLADRDQPCGRGRSSSWLVVARAVGLLALATPLPRSPAPSTAAACSGSAGPWPSAPRCSSSSLPCAVLWGLAAPRRGSWSSPLTGLVPVALAVGSSRRLVGAHRPRSSPTPCRWPGSPASSSSSTSSSWSASAARRPATERIAAAAVDGRRRPRRPALPAGAALAHRAGQPARLRRARGARRGAAHLRAAGSPRAIPMDELLLQLAESLRKSMALAAAEVWTGAGRPLRAGRRVGARPCRSSADRGRRRGADRRGPGRRVGQARGSTSGCRACVRAGSDSAASGSRRSPTRGELLGLIVAARPPDSEPFTDDDDTRAHRAGPPGRAGPAQRAARLRAPGSRSTSCGARPTSCSASRAAHRGRRRRGAPQARAQPPRRRPAAPGGAGRQAPPGPPARRATTREASGRSSTSCGGDVQEAVQELRALAHGIYPPLLIDRGLAEALRAAAGRAALPTEVDADGLEPLLARDRGGGLLLLPRGDAERGQARRRGRHRRRPGVARTTRTLDFEVRRRRRRVRRQGHARQRRTAS